MAKADDEGELREVVLVVETSYHYYVRTNNDADALAEATRLLDMGEPDHNPACGWLKVIRNEVKEISDG